MRTFNEREKAIIHLLNTINITDPKELSDILGEQYFPKMDQAIFIQPPTSTALMFISNEKKDNKECFMAEIYSLYELLSLIKYLKDNRYIDLFPIDTPGKRNLIILNNDWVPLREDSTEGKGWLGNSGLYYNIETVDFNIYSEDNNLRYTPLKIDKVIYNDLVNNLIGVPLISEELKQLEKRGFRTKEDIEIEKGDRRFKRTYSLAWVAIVVSIIIGLSGILSNCNNKNAGMNITYSDSVLHNAKNNHLQF